MNRSLFVSHSHSVEDQKLLRVLEELLDLARLEPVIAERQFEGTGIGKKVKRMIDGAAGFLALYTEAASGSAWVDQEIGYAEKKNTFVILLEQGTEFRGFRESAEKILFDRRSPVEAFSRAVRFLGQAGPVANPRVLEKALAMTERDLRPCAEKRVIGLMEVYADHQLVERNGFPVVTCHLKIETELLPFDQEDSWTFTAFADPSIRELLGESGPHYQVHRVEVGGDALGPTIETVHGWEVSRFKCAVPPGDDVRTLIDYEVCCFPEDLYYCQIARFCRRVRVVYQDNSDFVFDTVEGGVAQPLHPSNPGPIKGTVRFERKGLLLPGWTYILHWRSTVEALARLGKS